MALAISASRSSVGVGCLVAAARQLAPLPPPLPALGAVGLLKEAARSAARRQRLVGAASVGVAAGEAAAVAQLEHSSRPPLKLGAAPSSGVAAAAPSSVVWLRRSAEMATRPGVAAGCCSRRSSDATSCWKDRARRVVAFSAQHVAK